MKIWQTIVGNHHSLSLFRKLRTAFFICGIFLLSMASGWAMDIQFFNHSQDTVEAAIEFDSAVIPPGQSATLTVSQGGYSLIWGPVGTGYPYNSDGEIEHEDTKISYFGDEDFPRFSQYHLD